MTPNDIRASAARCNERRKVGFGVSVGEPARILADALRLYAANAERLADALMADAADERRYGLLAATHDEDESEGIRCTR